MIRIKSNCSLYPLQRVQTHFFFFLLQRCAGMCSLETWIQQRLSHPWVIVCLSQRSPRAPKSWLRGAGPVHGPLQSPQPEPRFMCLLPNAQVGKTPPVALSAWWRGLSAPAKELLSMHRCQIVVGRGDYHEGHFLQLYCLCHSSASQFSGPLYTKPSLNIDSCGIQHRPLRTTGQPQTS